MIEKFLYRIPNKYGMFEEIKVKAVKDKMGELFRAKMHLNTAVN